MGDDETLQPTERVCESSESSVRAIGRRGLPIAAEVGIAIAVALVLTRFGRYVAVNPLRRVGQVSGLASIQLALLVMMGALLLLLPLGQRLRKRELSLRLVCGGFSGLFGGVFAAGIVVALRGSAWPLNGQAGDAGVLQMWADAILDGRSVDGAYPPAYLYLVAGWARLFTDDMTGPALHGVEILVTALVAPAAYLAWRMLLPPLWALGIGVLASVPLINPYKPFTALVLVVLIPTVGKLFEVLQRSADMSPRRAAALGVGLGLLFGVLFLIYSGWFVWSLPGVGAVCVVLLVQQWRRSGVAALRNGLLTIGAAAATYGAVAGWYLLNLARASDTIDRYCYFDTYTEPTYFAMWRDDLPGLDARGTWPPPGELAGVGLFSIVLLIGLGVALSLGAARPAVLAAGACAASGLGLRYWFAAHMELDQAVQLYPRTSQQILYCLLVLSGLAVYLVVQRVRSWASLDPPASERSDDVVGGRVALGVLCALGLLFGMAGSASAMRYMPDETPRSSGLLAWNAHKVRNPDGSCSPYAIGGTCTDFETEVEVSTATDSELACFRYDGFPANP